MNKELIKIKCADKIELSATLFSPVGAIKAAVMLGPATGIKRQFYTPFAEYLVEHDYAVITFDNRGIGDSLTGKIKDCKASLVDWGTLDLSAALEYLKKNFPNTIYHLIGHSAGGQLVGLMPNALELSSIFNYACSSGRTKNMKSFFWLQAHFFMNIFIPFNNLLFGYTNTQWVGMGEPLPKQVAKEWAEWCNGKGYVQTAFGKTVHQHLYDEIHCPSIWINATDDTIANDENVEDMLEVFTKLKAERLTLDPKEYGFDEIGHMKFFSRKKKKLWTIAVEWLEKHS